MRAHLVRVRVRVRLRVRLRVRVIVDGVRAHRGDSLARPPLRAWTGITWGCRLDIHTVAGWAPRVAGMGYMRLQAGGAVRCAPIMEKRGTPLTRHSAVGEARQCALAM